MTTWSDVWRLIDVWHQKCSRPPLQRRDQLRSTRFQLVFNSSPVQHSVSAMLCYAMRCMNRLSPAGELNWTSWKAESECHEVCREVSEWHSEVLRVRNLRIFIWFYDKFYDFQVHQLHQLVKDASCRVMSSHVESSPMSSRPRLLFSLRCWEKDLAESSKVDLKIDFRLLDLYINI
jgi:hypothetical protein